MSELPAGPGQQPPGDRPRSRDVLRVCDLNVVVAHRRGSASVVRDVSFDVASGERVGLVGGSGSGKTLLARAIARLLPGGITSTGSIEIDGHAVDSLSPKRVQSLRRGLWSMVFQDPLTFLNPTMKIGRQVAEGRRPEDLADEVERALRDAGLDPGTGIADRYPHQLSGGMRQRCLMACALISRPKLLIADEPTTALDMTVQAQILDTLVHLSVNRGMALLLISHDLAVISQVCERVLVMNNGRIVESGATDDILTRPQHPYTRSLIDSHIGVGVDSPIPTR